MRVQLRRKRLSRSVWGDLLIFAFLAAGAAFTALPLVYTISNAFKPMAELFIWPPRFFVRNPTLANFRDLFALMGKSWVPISRYFFNSLFIVVFGVLGNVVIASLAAYALSIHEFPGREFFNEIIILSLMFAAPVLDIPKYLILSQLGWINTYAAVVVPTWGWTLGLYLMKKFIDSMIPDSLIEAARLDGASEFRIYAQIVMPIVKPAWLTLIILVFQQMWATTGGQFLYAEELKTLPYALNQIVKGGIARAGVAAAVTLMMMVVPILVFLFNQSKIVETMGTSGLD